jgi:hypothetical protein
MSFKKPSKFPSTFFQIFQFLSRNRDLSMAYGSNEGKKYHPSFARSSLCATPAGRARAKPLRPSLPGEMPILLIHALLAYRQIFGQQNPA